ncbi:hypothetical protein GGS21DRAFT_526622 [Xylaria nigripes]|nr:hypothetical protein GGS21DRAFT_526622 [Xylaria nigripes]
MMTNGVLKSALHRIGPFPGRVMPERYNFAYLMRPNERHDNATPGKPYYSFLRDSMEPVTCAEWVGKKFKA